MRRCSGGEGGKGEEGGGDGVGEEEEEIGKVGGDVVEERRSSKPDGCHALLAHT